MRRAGSVDRRLHPAAVCRASSVAARDAADKGSRHQQLHHLRSAVTDLEPDDIAHALLMRQVQAEAEMTMQQQTLMEHLHREFGRPPFTSGGEPSVRLTAILEP